MLADLAFVASLTAAPPTLPDTSPEEATVDLRLRLDWPGGSGCPSADEVGERLAALAPGIVLGDGGALAAVVGLSPIGPGPDRWATAVTIETPYGSQRSTFEAESCAVAADAVALLIAVLLDPVGVAAQLERADDSADDLAPAGDARAARPAAGGLEPGEDSDLSTSPPQTPGTARARSADIPADPARDLAADTTVDPSADLAVDLAADTPADPSADLAVDLAVDLPTDARSSRGSGVASAGARAALGVGLAVLGGGGYGPLRAGSGVIGGRFAVFARAWRWELRGAWAPPVNLDLGEGWEARFDGWWVGSRGCGVARPGVKLELPICAGVEAGRVRGRPAPTLPTATNATQPWVALELGPGLSWSPIARLALGVEAGLVVPLLRAAFTIDGDRVEQYSPAGFRALATVELRLGQL